MGIGGDDDDLADLNGRRWIPGRPARLAPIDDCYVLLGVEIDDGVARHRSEAVSLSGSPPLSIGSPDEDVGLACPEPRSFHERSPLVPDLEEVIAMCCSVPRSATASPGTRSPLVPVSWS